MSRESGVNNNMSNPTPDYKPQAHIANTLRDAFQSLHIDDDLLRIVGPLFFFAILRVSSLSFFGRNEALIFFDFMPKHIFQFY